MEPSMSGDGLPTATKIMFSSLSYAGVIQTPPPPRCHASALRALSAFSWVMLRWRSAPSGVVDVQLPNQPLGAAGAKGGAPRGAGGVYPRQRCRAGAPPVAGPRPPTPAPPP